MRRHHSFIDDLIAFEEWMERKEELKKKKTDTRKPRERTSSLGFFEGLVVAYIAQVMYGPLSKLFEVYIATHTHINP